MQGKKRDDLRQRQHGERERVDVQGHDEMHRMRAPALLVRERQQQRNDRHEDEEQTRRCGVDVALEFLAVAANAPPIYGQAPNDVVRVGALTRAWAAIAGGREGSIAAAHHS